MTSSSAFAFIAAPDTGSSFTRSATTEELRTEVNRFIALLGQAAVEAKLSRQSLTWVNSKSAATT